MAKLSLTSSRFKISDGLINTTAEDEQSGGCKRTHATKFLASKRKMLYK